MEKKIVTVKRKRQYRLKKTAAIFAASFLFAAAPAWGGSSEESGSIRQAGLDGCLEEALNNNHRRPASRYAVEMAEAQHKQALSGYWPQVTAAAGYKKMDESITFTYPSSVMSLPIGNIPIPSQKITVLDDNNYRASLETTWLLYDGGTRKGYREQTGALVDMMKQELRRTDLEVVDSVKRLYWGAVLARQLHQVGRDTLVRMETTLNLTETMYKEGSGRVKKTDWLNNKVMVETIRSMVALLEKNERVAQSALANTMGLSWDQDIVPLDKDMPYSSVDLQLDQLVSSIYMFNPDWSGIEAGLRAAEGTLKTARSGHYPKLAVTGKVYRWWHDSDAGLATEENEDGWNVGIGIELPLFNGMLTHNKIAEAKARIAKIREEQLLLKEGLGLQVKDIFLSLVAAEKAHGATLEAMDSATDNRKLNTRAYQNGLVETDDVVSAQLLEAMMAAQHYKARYEHLALLSRLNLTVGVEVLKRIQ